MTSSFSLTGYTSTVQHLQRQAASLLLYQEVLAGSVGQAFLDLLQALSEAEPDPLDCLRAYGRWFQALATQQQSWQDYLLRQILRADNPFTQQTQQLELPDLPQALLTAAKQDLQALQHLYTCQGMQISQWVQAVAQLPEAPAVWSQESTPRAGFVKKLQQYDSWAEALEVWVAHYRQWGTGQFAEYRMLHWQSGQLVGIAHPDPIRPPELVGYAHQQTMLVKNTQFLLAGYRALHVLLYGSRGAGKSSLVKALANEYGDRGLRLIEVAKSELRALPKIIDQLRASSLKFILFVDDLSFEEDDDAFKALKGVLEGSVTARAQNVVIYATSNRRHLVREFFEDRPRPSTAGEVHAWDTVQEKLSFSDRFGLTLTFEPADQRTYLAIARHLAALAQIPLAQGELDRRALQWATRHNGRSGRTARQFVDFLQAEIALAANQQKSSSSNNSATASGNPGIASPPSS